MSGLIFCTVRYGTENPQQTAYFPLPTAIELKMENNMTSNISRKIYETKEWPQLLWLISDPDLLFRNGFFFEEHADGFVSLDMRTVLGRKLHQGLRYVKNKDGSLHLNQSKKDKETKHDTLVSDAASFNNEKNRKRFLELRPQKIDDIKASGLLRTHAQARAAISAYMAEHHPGVPFSFVDLAPAPAPALAPAPAPALAPALAPAPAPALAPAPVLAHVPVSASASASVSASVSASASACASEDEKENEEKDDEEDDEEETREAVQQAGSEFLKCKQLPYNVSLYLLKYKKQRERVPAAPKLDPCEQSTINSFLHKERGVKAALANGTMSQAKADKEMAELTAWRDRKLSGTRDAQKRFEQFSAEQAKKRALTPLAIAQVHKMGGFFGSKMRPSQEVKQEVKAIAEKTIAVGICDSSGSDRDASASACNEFSLYSVSDKGFFEWAQGLSASAKPKPVYDEFDDEFSKAVLEEMKKDEAALSKEEKTARLLICDEAARFLQEEIDRVRLLRENQDRSERADLRYRRNTANCLREALQVDEDTQFMKRGPKCKRKMQV